MTTLTVAVEDIFWPNGSAVVVDTDTSKFRSAYATCAIRCAAGGTIKSFTFDGGEATTFWITARLRSGANYNSNLLELAFGAIKSGTAKGIFVGGTSGNIPKLGLYKYDGTTTTLLASESGASIGNSVVYRVDIQIANYGASGTVNVYLDGVLVITYSGDISISGVTGLDQIANTTPAASINSGFLVSEVLAAAADTRSVPYLKTLALTSFGTTHDFTGSAVSDINGTSFSDTTPHYSDVNNKEQQFNVTDVPAGTVEPAGISICARAARSSGSTPTKFALGWNDGGSVTLGSDIAATTAYANYLQNSNASLPALANMNALQIEIKTRP